MTQNSLILEILCLLFHDSDISQVEVEKRREEQRNFGVFFDDDYDYLQHLKEASGPTELVAAGPSHTVRQPIHLRDDEEEDDTDKAIPVSWLSFNVMKICFCLHLLLCPPVTTWNNKNNNLVVWFVQLGRI